MNFNGAPLCTLHCYCQSCLAAAVSKDGLYVEIAVFARHQIHFQGDVADRFYYISVGDGKNFRSATTCCNTIFGTAGGCHFPVPVQPVNRNGIKGFVAEDPYNIMAKYSHGTVPEPNSPEIPDDGEAIFMHVIQEGREAPNERAIMITDDMITVTLPKTWTDPE